MSVPNVATARIDARVRPLELEVAGVDHIAVAAGPDDLRALVGPAADVVRVRSLVVEHHEVAHPEDAGRVRIDGAVDRGRIGVRVDGGVDAGPQIDGQLVDVVQPEGDLVRAHDVRVAGGVGLDHDIVQRR